MRRRLSSRLGRRKKRDVSSPSDAQESFGTQLGINKKKSILSAVTPETVKQDSRICTQFKINENDCSVEESCSLSGIDKNRIENSISPVIIETSSSSSSFSSSPPPQTGQGNDNFEEDSTEISDTSVNYSFSPEPPHLKMQQMTTSVIKHDSENQNGHQALDYKSSHRGDFISREESLSVLESCNLFRNINEDNESETSVYKDDESIAKNETLLKSDNLLLNPSFSSPVKLTSEQEEQKIDVHEMDIVQRELHKNQKVLTIVLDVDQHDVNEQHYRKALMRSKNVKDDLINLKTERKSVEVDEKQEVPHRINGDRNTVTRPFIRRMSAKQLETTSQNDLTRRFDAQLSEMQCKLHQRKTEIARRRQKLAKVRDPASVLSLHLISSHETKKLQQKLNEANDKIRSLKNQHQEDINELSELRKRLATSEEIKVGTTDKDYLRAAVALKQARTQFVALEQERYHQDTRIKKLEFLCKESQIRIEQLKGEREHHSFNVAESSLNENSREYHSELEKHYQKLVEKWETPKKGDTKDIKDYCKYGVKFEGIEMVNEDSKRKISSLEGVQLKNYSTRSDESCSTETQDSAWKTTRRKDRKMKKETEKPSKELFSSSANVTQLKNEVGKMYAREIMLQEEILKLSAEKKEISKRLVELDGLLVASKSNDSKSSTEENIEMQNQLTQAQQKAQVLDTQLKRQKINHESELQQLRQELKTSQTKVSTLEIQFSRFIRKEPIDILGTIENANKENKNSVCGAKDDESSQGGKASEVKELMTEIMRKDDELQRKEEAHQMQVDQVEALREKLHNALMSLSDMEFELRFNNAKIQELSKLNIGDTDDEIREKLREKVIQCAETETKLRRSEMELVQQKELVDKLEQERSNNKDKVAELSLVRDEQFQNNAMRKEMQRKALTIADHLNTSLEKIEQLEAENTQYAVESVSLKKKLTESLGTIDDLGSRLVLIQMDCQQKDETIRTARLLE